MDEQIGAFYQFIKQHHVLGCHLEAVPKTTSNTLAVAPVLDHLKACHERKQVASRIKHSYMN